MSVEENKANERRVVEEILNKGNLSAIPELITTDYIYHGAAGMDVKGAEGFKRTVMQIRAAFPDLHVTIEDMVGEQDKVVVRLTYRGTHEGDLLGIPPTGKKTAITEIKIIYWQDGKAVEAWGILDMYGLMQQLGALPPTEEIG